MNAPENYHFHPANHSMSLLESSCVLLRAPRVLPASPAVGRSTLSSVVAMAAQTRVVSSLPSQSPDISCRAHTAAPKFALFLSLITQNAETHILWSKYGIEPGNCRRDGSTRRCCPASHRRRVGVVDQVPVQACAETIYAIGR